jgi:hypothetical protein
MGSAVSVPAHFDAYLFDLVILKTENLTPEQLVRMAKKIAIYRRWVREEPDHPQLIKFKRVFARWVREGLIRRDGTLTRPWWIWDLLGCFYETPAVPAPVAESRKRKACDDGC